MLGLAFFYQLTEFSYRYTKDIGLDGALSPWGHASYEEGGPIGAVIHYTADEDFHRVLKWFIKEAYQARVSAHVVVADCKMPWHDELAEGLPLIQALPVTVVQTRKHTTTAWHARWANGFTYSIENICAGELRLSDDGWVTTRPRDLSAPEWSAPWEPTVPKIPIHLYGKWWSPYTAGQIAANIQILRYLHEIYPLQPEWILGHDMLSEDKWDPGPAYPIHDVRDEVLVDGSFEDLVWFQNFKSDPLYGQIWRDYELRKWAAWLFGREVNWNYSLIESRFKAFMEDYKYSSYLGIPGAISLRLLGYYVPETYEMYSDAEILPAVEIFMRMAKIDPVYTRAVPEALVSRLYDREIIK